MNREFWKNKRVLITGAEGFVGYHFCDDLFSVADYVVGTALTEEKTHKIHMTVNLTNKRTILKE